MKIKLHQLIEIDLDEYVKDSTNHSSLSEHIRASVSDADFGYFSLAAKALQEFKAKYPDSEADDEETNEAFITMTNRVDDMLAKYVEDVIRIMFYEDNL